MPLTGDTVRPRSNARIDPHNDNRAMAGFRGSRLFERLAMTASDVVEIGLAGLDRNRAVVVPGWVNKVVSTSTRFTPRPWARKIAGSVKY